MRVELPAGLFGVLGLLAMLGCRSEPERGAPPTAVSAPSARELAQRESAPRPVSSELVAVHRRMQEGQLRLPAHRDHQRRLAFGRGVFAQLGAEALRIFATEHAEQPKLLVEEPVEGPRTLVALSDGSLLAIDAHRLLRWEPGWKRAKSLPRPILLPDAEVYADAQRTDLVWVFEPSVAGSPAKLSSFALGASLDGVPLPEQTIELLPKAPGVLGVTREGVWLHVTRGSVERFAPSGARLPALELEPAPPPDWVLAALRVDQSLWLTETGELSRVLVSPSFRRLAKASLSGTVFDVDVGDQGRLLAAVTITGAGPRFELELLDAELQQKARVALPAEAPTGADDWVQVVTQNQQVVASRHAERVAVGGPGRATIFDGSGRVIFSIPSR